MHVLTQTHTSWGVEPFTLWASVWGLNVNSRMYIKAPILFKNPPVNVLWQSHANMGGTSTIASSLPLIWKLPTGRTSTRAWYRETQSPPFIDSKLEFVWS